MQKKLLLVNDLSGIGKVAISPMNTIINCAGAEVSLLPTCILSSHTGGLAGVYIDDYSKGMDEFLRQWQALDLRFDTILTGYFRNSSQIDKVLEFKDSVQGQDSSLIVDPVMADRGKMYSGFSLEYIQKMNELCARAELIIPNFTEACLLTGKDFEEKNTNINEIKELTLALSDNGKKSVIITGIKLENDLTISFFDKKSGLYNHIKSENLPFNFFGTGDMFTAIVSTCFSYNIGLDQGVKLANDWLLNCLKHTIKIKKDIKYGICFEPFLKDLITNMERLRGEN